MEERRNLYAHQQNPSKKTRTSEVIVHVQACQLANKNINISIRLTFYRSLQCPWSLVHIIMVRTKDQLRRRDDKKASSRPIPSPPPFDKSNRAPALAPISSLSSSTTARTSSTGVTVASPSTSSESRVRPSRKTKALVSSNGTKMENQGHVQGQPFLASNDRQDDGDLSELSPGAIQVSGYDFPVSFPASDRNVQPNGFSDNSPPYLVNAEVVLDDEERLAQMTEQLERRIRQQIEAQGSADRSDRTHVVAEVLPGTKLCGWQKKTWWIIFAIFILLIIVVTMIVVLRPDPDPSSTPSLSPTTFAPSGSPTTFGSESPTFASESPTFASESPTTVASKLAELRQKLEPFIVRTDADKAILEDPNSPQSQALAWLSTVSVSVVDNISTNFALEQYASAVLYFSTNANGANWNEENSLFNDSNSICDFNNGASSFVAVGSITCNGASVQSVQLVNNGLSGTLPWELSLLSNIEHLDLSENELRETIPTEFSRMTAMTFLALYENSLTSTLPSELGMLTNLEAFIFDQNQLTGSLPTELGQLTALTKFSVWGNYMTGRLPSELVQLRAVQDYWINNNEFTGSLQTEVGLLTLLQQFHIDDNRLAGPLPSELGNLAALSSFRLFNNQFTGTIPSEIGEVTGLRTLYMHLNNFVGPLPSELGMLTSMIDLLCNNNSLTGSLPSELGLLTALTRIGISGNNFSSPLPQELQDTGLDII